MNIELPNVLQRITAPAERIIFRSNSQNDRINLTNNESIERHNKTDKSVEVLITLIDKLMFGIFFIIIISLHL